MSAAPTTVSQRSSAEQPTGLLSAARRRLIMALGLVLLLFFVAFASDSWMSILNFTLIYAIAAIGLNVVSGYTGQVSLGIAFFMSIGAYTAIFFGSQPDTLDTLPPVQALGLGLPFFIWLPAAGVAAAIVGALIGPTALRLKGFYLGIVTLSLIFIGQHIFKNTLRLSGGSAGRSFIASDLDTTLFSQQHDIFATGFAITTQQEFFLLVFPILILSAIFVSNVMRSRTGRAFQAVRDNEVGASIMGVNLFQAKMGAFILSSFLAGLAGALWVVYIGNVKPQSWDLLLSIQFVAAIIVGGIATVWGSILGAAFVFALPSIIDKLNLLPATTSTSQLPTGDLNALLYGLLIIAFLLFEPGGIVGLLRRGQSLALRYNRRIEKGEESAKAVMYPEPNSQSDLERMPLSADEGAQPLAE